MSQVRRIDQLPAAQDIGGADQVTVWQGGRTRVALVDDLLRTVSKTALGLDQVNNTSDANKPISIAQAAALSAKANKADLGSAAGASITQLAAPNLFTNSDFTIGTSAATLQPNDALDVVNVRGWVMQQSTITPFMSVKRTIAPGGGYAIRLTNGIPSGTTATIANTGTVTFSVPPDHNFRPNIEVTAAYALDPSIFMRGPVTAITGSTVTIAPNFVNGAGTYSEWAIGRPGVTTRGQTFRTTTAATTPGDANQGYVLYFSDASDAQIGACIETSATNNIQKATYIVSKTSTSITLSKPVTGAGVPLGASITEYGAQGIYGYQNVTPSSAKDFKNGTPYARTSYFSFGCRSFYCEGTRASVMVLGYKSLFELGTSYAQAFDITSTPNRVSVPILGDTVGAPGTWVSGYDSTDGHPYMTVGPVWESNDTPTSRNIPVGQWRPDVFAVGGSDQQTLALSARVGSWVEYWEPKLEFDLPTSYRSDLTTLPAVEEIRVRAPVNPLTAYEATRNGTDLKKWLEYVNANGDLDLASLNDAETSSFVALRLGRGGSARFPAYPAGDAVLAADGTLGAVPNAFTTYSPAPVSAGGGTATFTGSTASFRAKTGEIELKLNVKATAVTPPSPDNGAATVVVNLPAGVTADGIGATLTGYDRGFFGEPIFGWIAPGATTMQLFKLGTKTDTTFGKVYPLRTGADILMYGKFRTA